MDNQNINQLINDKIYKGKLSQEQTVFFAWLCGVRVLPFLCESEGFISLEKKYKIEILYGVFYALDVISYRASDSNFNYNAQNIVDKFLNLSIGKNIHAVYALGEAVFSAISADRVSAEYTVGINYIDEEMFSVSNAPNIKRINDTASHLINTAEHFNIDLSDILRDDLNHINKIGYNFHNDISIYGMIWSNFQKSLNNLGLEYWGNLYANIFENKFELDKEDLKRRLNVPKEIQEQGAKAVTDYLINIEKQGSVYVQRETRLMILGSAGAGKTTLTRRLNGDSCFPNIGDSTHGVDTNVKLDLNGIKTHVWDFGGQAIYHASHKCFISENCVYILVVNARTEDSRDINRIKYWLDTIRIYSGGKAKVFIIINESDERELDVEEYNSFKEGEYESLVHEIYSFNIGKDMDSIVGFKKDLTAYIGAVGHQVFGQNDAHSIRKINALFEQGEQIIEKDTLIKILENSGIKKEKDRERTKRLFDTLGIALSYDYVDGYVLDPYWICHGVYKVIDYLQRYNSMFISYNELDEVFADERKKYPPKKRKYILDLMEHHKIGFSSKGGIRGLVVPCVAARFKPKDIIIDKDPDCLIIHVEREDLQEFPADFFYRYMCANEEDIKIYGEKMAIWQTGMVLAKGNASALVELIENRRIEITVWGEKKDEHSQKMQLLINDLLVEYHFTSYKENRKKGNKIIETISLALESIAKGTVKANTFQKRRLQGNEAILPSEEKIVNHILNNQNYYFDKNNMEISLGLTSEDYKLIEKLEEKIFKIKSGGGNNNANN